MLTFETLAAFVLASLVIELTPGPNMTYLALLAARHGRRPGYAAVVGVAVGLGVLGLLASLGLATLLQSSPPLYGVLRWGGVAYLLYLAGRPGMKTSPGTPPRMTDAISPGA